MIRLLISLCVQFVRTGFTGRLLLLFGLVLLISYIIKTWRQIGKQ